MAYLNSKFQSGFSPQNIPGLAVWLDAADSNAVGQAAGVVSNWVDKSPNAYNMSQATAGARPTYETNVQNGRPSLRFTTAQALTSTGSVSLTGQQTWFLSFKPLAAGNLFFIEQSTDTNNFSGGYFYGGNNYLFYINRSGTGRSLIDTAGSQYSVGTWYITSVTMSNISNVATDYYYTVNGVGRSVIVSAGLPGNTIVSSNLYINPTARVPGSNYMGELIIYNRALSRGEIQLTERYLASKWGVTLSNTHPYFSVPASLRPFNPFDVSGLTTWFDAADTRRMTLSGSNVVSWGDKATLDMSLNASAGAQGVLTTNSAGYPCVQCAATTTYTSTRTDLSRTQYFSDTSTCTLFAVQTTSTTNPSTCFFNFVSTTNNVFRVAIFMSGTATFWDAGASSDPRQTVFNVQTVGTPQISMYRRAGLVTDLRSYGTLTTATNPSNTSTIAPHNYQIVFPHPGAGSSGWIGDIHEFLWYNRALPDTDINQVEAYLAEKWGRRGSLTSNSPMRFYRSLSPVFNPTLLSNCIMWLDSADYSSFTFSNVSNVLQWNDKSGTGNNAVLSNSAAPIYVSNSLNNTGTLSFNASNDGLYVSSNFTTSAYPSLCYFIVIRPAATQPNTTFAGILSTDTNGQYGRSLALGAGSWQQEYYSNFVNITPYTANSWAVVSLQFNTTVSATLSVNGTTYAGAASGTGNNTLGLKIGSYLVDVSFSSFNANFDTAEILIYGSSLTTAQRQLVEGYLANKWGLASSLPSNHPYKTIRV